MLILITVKIFEALSTYFLLHSNGNCGEMFNCHENNVTMQNMF